MRYGAFDCILRTSWSMSHCRVPMVPREVTSARGSWATYATALVSLWTSMPIKRVRDCDMVDLREFSVDVATSSGTGCGKLTRVTSGVNLPPLEVIMSRQQSEFDHRPLFARILALG